ncbi:MAG: CPBP family intramembrane metalloprotease [Thermoanaerobaculales bacterium]|nr:CPBP family intramembrane metalloprotease [Thermoanaerobaculales bacterium]
MNDDHLVAIWHGWSTSALGAVTLIAFVIGQTVAAIGYLVVVKLLDPQVNIQALANNIMGNGTLLSLSILVGSLAGCGVTILFAWLKAKRRTGIYLGLSRSSPRTLLICAGATALFVAVADSTTHFLDRPIVPEFMASGYETVTFKPLFWLAVCLAAPLFEELFFRGFLFPGWTRVLGQTGAVVATSLVWTGIHFQYGLYELSQVFLLGLMFGTMKVKTGSTIPSFVCHVIANVIATVEAVIFVNS